MSGWGVKVVGLETVLKKLPDEKKLDKALQVTALMIERESKRICPVRTGRLRASIHTGKLGKLVYYVGTNVEYAPYVEFGTRKMAARPYLRPAARKVANIMRGKILEV